MKNLNLVGRENWFGEISWRPSFGLTESLSHLSREIAEAVAVAGRDVDPTHLQDAFQSLESAITAKSQKEALFQRKEIYRTSKHLVEQAYGSGGNCLGTQFRTSKVSRTSRSAVRTETQNVLIHWSKSGTTYPFVPAVFDMLFGLAWRQPSAVC